MTAIHFREANQTDLDEMKRLYVETIREVCKNDYDAMQVAQWSSSANNAARWDIMMQTQYVLLAETADCIAGFATLKDGNYIDFFYIHKHFQRLGIAAQLLERIETRAKMQRHTTITSDISITARPFFEKNGYAVLREQHNARGEVILINYKMSKELVPD